jgi:hypothetical protein
MRSARDQRKPGLRRPPFQSKGASPRETRGLVLSQVGALRWRSVGKGEELHMWDTLRHRQLRVVTVRGDAPRGFLYSLAAVW